jgi:chromosome segregation ATPase
MIEQLMIFALGFSAAALFALAILPAFWDRATRLTRRRLEAQMPVAPEQITAARDQLRAEFAVEQRRLEMRLDATLAAKHADLSEIGRRTAIIRERDEELRARKADHDALIQQHEALTESANGIAASLAETRTALTGLLEAHAIVNGEWEQLKTAHAALEQLAAERKAEILSQETLIEGIRARGRDLETMLATARNELTARSKALRAMEQEHRTTAALKQSIEKELDVTKKRLASTTAALERRNEERKGLMQALKENEARISTMSLSESQASTALATERARVETLEQQLARQRTETQQTIRDLINTIDQLKSEKSLLSGALEGARKERARGDWDMVAPRNGANSAKTGESVSEKPVVRIGKTLRAASKAEPDLQPGE